MIFSCSFFLYLICAPSPWFSMQHFATTKKLSLVLMSSLGKAEHVYNKNIKLSFLDFLKFGSSCRNSTWWLCNLIILMHLRTDWSMMRGLKVKLVRENPCFSSDQQCWLRIVIDNLSMLHGTSCSHHTSCPDEQMFYALT